MSTSGDDLAARGPGLAPAATCDVHADRARWSEFLAPEPFGDLDPSLYRFETTASPAAAVEAWMAAQPLAGGDATAALVVDRAETRLRAVTPDQMARYDRLRSEGREPLEAMRAVAPSIGAGGVEAEAGCAAVATAAPEAGRGATPGPFGPWDSLSGETRPAVGLEDDVPPQAPGRQLGI